MKTYIVIKSILYLDHRQHLIYKTHSLVLNFVYIYIADLRNNNMKYFESIRTMLSGDDDYQNIITL